MKIDLNKIPLEGAVLEEEISASVLELDTETVKFLGPVKVRAEVFRITNAVTVNLKLNGLLNLKCSRCLKEFEANFKKDLRLDYQVDRTESALVLDQDIKEEIILDYPIKPLCKPDCIGLCHKCGKNLNEGGCSCAIT